MLAAVTTPWLTGIVGIVGAAVGSFFTGAAQSRTARLQHDLEAKSRHIERAEGRRADLYPKMLANLHTALANMNRAYPWDEQTIPRPPAKPHIEDERDLFLLSGQVSAYGSEEVDQLLREWQKTRREYFAAGASITTEGARCGIDAADQHRTKLEELRLHAADVLDSIERQVRAELQPQ
jgi:hypothetical protein